MLEKNKDYVEFTLHCTTVERSRDRNYQEVCFNGYSDSDFPGVPMDVVCKESGHKVVMISKRAFDRLQTENEQLKNKLEECEKDYISARDKVEALDKEIGVYSRALKDWKDGTGCPSPSAAKTLIENGRTHIVYLNDPLGVIAKWEKVTGYDRPEDFLKWKADIERIMEAWKDRTGCKYPGEAGELLEKWKTLTKCETPEAAATWITSYESACERGNRLAESVGKLKEEVVSWKNVTGYSVPEDYMHARISGAFHTPFDYTAAWQKATGCDSPEAAETTLRNLRGRIDEIKTFAAIASNWTDRIVED